MKDFSEHSKADTSGYESDLESTPGQGYRRDHLSQAGAAPSYHPFSLGPQDPYSHSRLSPNPRPRRRRDRTRFSPAGLARLEAVFSADPYPDINGREALAAELRVTEDRIQVWFQNRRSKNRRLHVTRPPRAILPLSFPTQTASPGEKISTQSPPSVRNLHSLAQGNKWGTPVTINGDMVVHSIKMNPPRELPQRHLVEVSDSPHGDTLSVQIKETPMVARAPGGDNRDPKPFVPRRPWETPSPPCRKRVCLGPASPENEDIIAQAPINAQQATQHFRQDQQVSTPHDASPGGLLRIAKPAFENPSGCWPAADKVWTPCCRFGPAPDVMPALPMAPAPLTGGPPTLPWATFPDAFPRPQLCTSSIGYYKHCPLPTLIGMPLYAPLKLTSAGFV